MEIITAIINGEISIQFVVNVAVLYVLFHIDRRMLKAEIELGLHNGKKEKTAAR